MSSIPRYLGIQLRFLGDPGHVTTLRPYLVREILTSAVTNKTYNWRTKARGAPRPNPRWRVEELLSIIIVSYDDFSPEH